MVLTIATLFLFPKIIGRQNVYVMSLLLLIVCVFSIQMFHYSRSIWVLKFDKYVELSMFYVHRSKISVPSFLINTGMYLNTTRLGFYTYMLNVRVRETTTTTPIWDRSSAFLAWVMKCPIVKECPIRYNNNLVKNTNTDIWKNIFFLHLMVFQGLVGVSSKVFKQTL